MPDYDIQAVKLASPPVFAPVAAYRPAVEVRNNGIHPADVTGVLRIYDRATGELLNTKALAVIAVPAGGTANALADSYWQPVIEDIGREFLFIADVTTFNDQVETNNHLSPVTVIIAPTEPPEPPPVTAHAAQHEAGGADELILSGLHGQLADLQPVAAHKATHEIGGTDEITMAATQDHHAQHEDRGGDELNVDELSGVLKNLQKPKIHANEAHDPNYATAMDLTDHKVAATAHQNRRNAANGFCGLDNASLVDPGQLAPVHIPADHSYLRTDQIWALAEEKENKGQASGYAPLDAYSFVPVENLGLVNTSPPQPDPRVLHHDQTWRDPDFTLPAHHGTHDNGGNDEISIAGLSGKAADGQDPVGHHISHENGGNDEISIAGLSGKAADGQDPIGHHVSHEPGGSDQISGIAPSAHKSTHENNGSDEISVAGLSGKLSDEQRSDFSEGHDTQTTVPPAGPETTILTLSVPANRFSDRFSARLKSHFQILLTAGINPHLKIRLRKDTSEAVLLDYAFNPIEDSYIDIEADVFPWSPGHYAASLRILGTDTTNIAIVRAADSGGGYTMPTTPTDFKLTVEPIDVEPNTLLYSQYAFGYTTSHIP